MSDLCLSNCFNVISILLYLLSFTQDFKWSYFSLSATKIWKQCHTFKNIAMLIFIYLAMLYELKIFLNVLELQPQVSEHNLAKEKHLRLSTDLSIRGCPHYSTPTPTETLYFYCSACIRRMSHTLNLSHSWLKYSSMMH